jgi:serine/threonine protein kinase
MIYYDTYCYELNSYISDFGLSGPANKQKSDDKIYGLLPYIAPEVLIGKPYTLSSDIYSFGVIMFELSSGKPPFYDREHDLSLALDICNGLRPEFGKGTPEIYKKLAYRCMNADPNQRPNVDELKKTLLIWYYSIYNKIIGYKEKKIKTTFKEANKQIQDTSSLYENDSKTTCNTSQVFTFNNLPKPINSSTITSYLEEDNNEGIL